MHARDRPQHGHNLSASVRSWTIATFEVLGQRRAAVVIALGRGLLGGGYRRRGATLAAPTEPVLQGGVEFGFEFGVLGAEFLEFGEPFTNHRLERGHVGRQRRIGSKRGGAHAL